MKPELFVMNEVESKLQALLLNELECPVCNEFMLPPITHCRNGHNIGSCCKPKLQTCPTCRAEITDIRSLTVEKLIAELLYPCTYRQHGCKETYPAFLISNHQEMCPYSPFSCPADGCDWKGSHSGVYAHVVEQHTAIVYVSEDNDLVVVEQYESDKEYRDIRLAHEGVFISLVKVINEIWHFVLLYVGSQESASHFEYTVTLNGKNDRGCIKVSHSVQSIKEDVENLFKTCMCVKLPLDVIEGFKMENDLFFYLDIKRM